MANSRAAAASVEPEHQACHGAACIRACFGFFFGGGGGLAGPTSLCSRGAVLQSFFAGAVRKSVCTNICIHMHAGHTERKG